MARDCVVGTEEMSKWTRGVELALQMPFGSLATRDAHLVTAVRKDLNTFQEYLGIESDGSKI